MGLQWKVHQTLDAGRKFADALLYRVAYTSSVAMGLSEVLIAMYVLN